MSLIRESDMLTDVLSKYAFREERSAWYIEWLEGIRGVPEGSLFNYIRVVAAGISLTWALPENATGRGCS